MAFLRLLGLMTVKEHEAVVAGHSNVVERYEASLASKDETIERIVHERDSLSAELATLKSARERQLANLAKGSAASAAKRKAKAGEAVSHG